MPAKPRAPLALGAALAALLAVGVASGATGLRTTPSRLSLDPGERQANLTLDNTGSGTLRARARIYRWTQEDGEDRLLPTSAAAVSPPLMEIAPGQRQTLRVVVLQRDRPPDEASYRVVLDQLPDPDTRGPQTVLRYSAPVFVAGSSAAGSNGLSASLQRRGQDWTLRIDNHGTRHARLADLAYRSAGGGRTLLAPSLAGYVLPGRYRTWPLPRQPGDYADGRFLARVGEDPAERELPLRTP
jgi:fimbrial chaperone protein